MDIHSFETIKNGIRCLYCYNKILFLFCKDALDFSMAERTLKIQCNNKFDTSVPPVQNPRTVGLKMCFRSQTGCEEDQHHETGVWVEVSDSCLLKVLSINPLSGFCSCCSESIFVLLPQANPVHISRCLAYLSYLLLSSDNISFLSPIILHMSWY